MQDSVANRGGRPSKFTQTLADEVCERISKGEPLAVICRGDRMPHRSTVSAWCLARPKFGVSFAQARELGFDWLATECLEIADTPLIGKRIKTSKDGTETVVEDMLGHRKLQIETRLKLLAKWDPKRYGEKLDLNNHHTGDIVIEIGGNVV